MTSRRSRWLVGGCLVFGMLLAACSSSDETGGEVGASGGGATGGAGRGGGGGRGGSGAGGAAGGGVAGASGGQMVGPSGATITESGVTLAVPANAVAATMTITVTTTTAPVGYDLASAAYEFGPSGTTFAQPVAVTIPMSAGVTDAHKLGRAHV